MPILCLLKTCDGVTKAPFVNSSESNIFDLAQVPVRFFESHWYLAGVTTAEPRRHLSNINFTFNIDCVFSKCWKIRKITERGKSAQQPLPQVMMGTKAWVSPIFYRKTPGTGIVLQNIEMKISSWRNLLHLLHQKLSKMTVPNQWQTVWSIWWDFGENFNEK